MNQNSNPPVLAHADWLSPSVHPAYARLLCAHLRNKGVDMQAVFQGNSLSWEELLERPRFISFDQFRRLISNAMRLTDCPWLGLEISTMIQVSAHGPLGYGAVAARTVRQAFRLVEQNLGTRLTIYDFSLEELDGRALFILHERVDPGELREFVFVMLLGSFLDLLEKISGEAPTDLTVRFPFAEPDWSHLYAERFPGIQISFGQPRFVIDMPGDFLDYHCLTADEFAYRNAVRECEQLLSTVQKGGDLSDQIKQYLFENGAPYPSQDAMAEHFNISVRTLIRRLKAEHTSYQSLLDEVRKELACWHLQNSSLSIERIAETLGFQDTSNFSRVFRRWLGCTPSVFRNMGNESGSKR